MKLIADSGGTKTLWTNGEKIFETQGIHPYFNSEDEILTILQFFFINQKAFLQPENITEIQFYGAGCGIETQDFMQKTFQKFFQNASHIEIQPDTLGVARACLGNESGFVGILGTGANMCTYDGTHITSNDTSTGFILGDEGSGAFLGKILISDFLKELLPLDLKLVFLEKYPTLDRKNILENIYKKPQANKYLASFTPFFAENINHIYIQKNLALSFSLFLSYYKEKYQIPPHNPIHFVGSIAFYFQENLKKSAQLLNLSIGNIFKNPIEGLKVQKV